MRETVETTYADLRPTDLVIDKSGKAWPIAELFHDTQISGFWLSDPLTKVRMHHVTKFKTDTVTVSRVPDEPAPAYSDMPDEVFNEVAHDLTGAELHEAVAAVEEIGGEVEVTYTEKEADAAKAATDDSPVRLPAFEDMTILEMRSHLYLLHGVYAHDMKSRVDTIAMHVQAHADHEAGRLASRHVPHVHEVK